MTNITGSKFLFSPHLTPRFTHVIINCCVIDGRRKKNALGCVATCSIHQQQMTLVKMILLTPQNPDTRVSLNRGILLWSKYCNSTWQISCHRGGGVSKTGSRCPLHGFGVTRSSSEVKVKHHPVNGCNHKISLHCKVEISSIRRAIIDYYLVYLSPPHSIHKLQATPPPSIIAECTREEIEKRGLEIDKIIQRSVCVT